MYPISLQDLVNLTQATAASGVSLSSSCDGAVIDSRDTREGDLFFALQGKKCHGLDFAQKATADGAVAIMTEDLVGVDDIHNAIIVPDTEIALAELAHYNRRQSDALIVGVTGTVGKTTTRRLISSVLETGFTGIQSPNNFNNHLGVPLSLLELQEGDEYGVIEIATSISGDIQALSAITRPEMAVVTRVTPVHFSGFSSLKAVQQEKQQLVASLDRDGIAFLNADDPLVMQMANVCSGQVISYGFSEQADVRITDFEQLADGIQLTVNGVDYEVPLMGQHLASNVAAAIAVGLEVGLGTQQIADGLRRFQNMPGRQQLQQIGDWSVIDDSYNSSPASVVAAIDCVQSYQHCKHRVMILNDMLDLGDQSQDLHFGIGATLANSSVEHIVVMGEFAPDLVEGFQSAGGHQSRISEFKSIDHFMPMADCLLSPGDAVLVKGSRGTVMENVISKLANLATVQHTAPSIRDAA
ncbi:MAG: UDP-N-acetylmuramoyl-tripeptide--D-alanyl-D-alanine ligase [Fuerstiella sp.]